MVKVDDRFGKKVSFEFSVPRVLRGSNETPASPEEVVAAVGLVYDSAGEVVDFTTEQVDLEVRRCDYVRDFSGVSEISAILYGLAAVPQAKGRLRGIYNDPHRGSAQTLRVGTKGRWIASAYDKGQEMLAAASRIRDVSVRANHRHRAHQVRASGRLRVEVGVRADPLRERMHTNRLGALLDVNDMTNIARHYFDVAGLGTTVGGTTKVVDALKAMRDNPADYKMADRLLGVLQLEALGFPQSANPHTVHKYRALAKRYGLTAADLVTPDRPSLRLDWETGTVVEESDQA